MLQTSKHANFVQLLMANYTRVKARFPHEGRRKWQLHVLQDFWASLPGQQNWTPSSSKAPADEFMQDLDPFDELINAEEPGIVLRTDYSDESAWEIFRSKLRDAEEEIKSTFTAADDDDEPTDEQDSSSESSADAPPVIKVINPATPELRALFNNVSNLTALRLLNDVDIQPSPAPPSGTKRIHPPNRLIDQEGWQEIYTGHKIWIYDEQSNSDQCARLVSQQGDVYGTATGDSWRARVTHIYELQFNMSYLGMKIDFGGLDRWDLNERRRNLEEAALLR
ncbi:hypothetical protein AX15_007717 [Amanita polypyramis BW_CC]|nr:hypothetical protein AX15_007717 [Amanita polypyramis BW_CC]